MKVNPDTLYRQCSLACGMWKHRCASGLRIRSGGIFHILSCNSLHFKIQWDSFDS